MNRDYSRFDSLTSILAGTVTVAGIVVFAAISYFDLRQMPKSIADYSKAIALNAGYVDAYYNRGLVLSALGDKPGAIADYTQVIRLDRNFAAAYNN